jgi:DNA-binding SARP family transcriptional activator/Flp pilus assembly protein TadD
VVRLLTFGPPELHRAERPVAVPPKQFALLSYLAVASPGPSVRRDILLGVFWPDCDEGHARNALNQTLFQIRHLLGRDAVASHGKADLVLGFRDDVDAVRFRELLRRGDDVGALDLYRGDFLEGFHLPGAEEFDRWLDATRADFRELARAAAEAAGERCREATPVAAVGWYRRSLGVDATSETALRGLMESLVRSGDAAGALAAYRRHATRLAQDYGVRPSHATVALAERIRSGAAPLPSADSPRAATWTMTGGVARRMPPERSVALGLVARASGLVERTHLQHETAVGLLEEAVRVDPGCAEAQAALASTLTYRVQVFGGARKDLTRAVELSGRAIALSPHLAGGHLALGVAWETAGRLSAAGASLRRATRFAPGDSASAVHLSRVTLWAGDFASSMRRLTSVLAGRSDDSELALQLGLGYCCLAMNEEAEQWLARALALKPNHHWAQGIWCYMDLCYGRIDQARARAASMLRKEPDNFMGLFYGGQSALQAGDYPTARDLFERAHQLDPGSRDVGTHRSTRTMLAYVASMMRERTTAAEFLEQAEAQNLQDLAAGSEFCGEWQELAAIQAVRGERDAALHSLERAFATGWRQGAYLRRDPLFATLRREERFQSVVHAIDRDLARQRTELGGSLTRILGQH